jgi:hypothetical protein
MKHVLLRTDRALQVDVAEAAGEEQPDLHVALVDVPDAHPVVSHHGAHRVVACVVEFLLAQLEDLADVKRLEARRTAN